jgi:hypothetical protein
MCRKIVFLIILVLAQAAGAQTVVEFFSDDFETPHDYVANNVAGTGWDGYFGWLPGETVDALNASIERPGQLYMASTNGAWDPWTNLGPYLYKYVEGDFIATVYVADYAGTVGSVGYENPNYHNNCGLMARASKADPNDEAGPGEDWVSIDYFPIWNCGNFVRSANNDIRTEHGHNGKAWDLDPYLQLERSGNVFHLRTSSDGVSWTEMATSPLTRNDFDGLPLMVGVFQCTYSENSGYAVWDDFKVVLIRRFKAYNPVPGNAAMNVDPNQDLSWNPGSKAEFHDVYFGTSFDDVNNADNSTTEIYKGRQSETSYEPGPLTLGGTYYWRIDEVNEADNDSPWRGPVWSFRVMAWEATEPSPPNGAECVTLDTILSWIGGAQATTHWVYFGTINPPPFKALRSVTTYEPPELEPDTLYYWRIDEKKGMETWPGEVWTFRTVPAVPTIDPNLVGWWKFDEVCEQSDTVLDSSGQDNHGKFIGDIQYGEGFEHDALEFDGRDDYVELPIGSVISSLTNCTFTIWLDSEPGGSWVRAFDFGTNDPNVYMCLGPRWWFMDDMYFAITTEGAAGQILVQPTGFDIETGWHHVSVTIDADRQIMILYYDGEELARNDYAVLSPSALGETTNNWLGRSHDENDSYYLGSIDDFRIYNYALSQAEIGRVMVGDPLLAWNPKPADGSTPDVEHVSPMSWSPGDNAAQHDVYFGTDTEAVENADVSDTTNIYRGRQDANTYTPPEVLEWGQTYCWRIDEYNNDQTLSKGRLWSFTTLDYLIVDDFESYNDLNPDEEGSKRIFFTWVDGFDNPSINGSTMGYPNPSFADGEHFVETQIVHSGNQSAPLFYDNSVAGYSEVTVNTFDLTIGQDWTKGDVQVLTLWFYGDPNNAATEQLYVKLNGAKVLYNGDAADLATAEWTQWDIDLSAFGINLTNVTEMSIGLERIGASQGSGVLFIDDIRLYREAP